MRFTMSEGPEVTVKVNSPKVASAAIKELRHRKKEVGLHRRALLRLQRRALKERARLERAAGEQARRRGLFGSLARVASLFRAKQPLHDLESIEHELHLVDETLHNVDVCIVQIEGKLLLHG
jgi:hypothetical protein